MLPSHIELINNTLSIRWNDSSESFLPAPLLRQFSPSAENIGEPDLFGNNPISSLPPLNPSITITRFYPVGNYALAIHFSDNHTSGIFPWHYLKSLPSLQITSQS